MLIENEQQTRNSQKNYLSLDTEKYLNHEIINNNFQTIINSNLVEKNEERYVSEKVEQSIDLKRFPSSYYDDTIITNKKSNHNRAQTTEGRKRINLLNKDQISNQSNCQSNNLTRC